ncbi:DUF4855 domain-containing protein [Alicyclobacillus acidoterrestris]|uniref:DUF4855 domain-containing protein n=1 Tax=Alicyclobacillus TaxID=29330 RepID=UPI001197FE7D|nr:DUF4855 domain-containing protein [Alicyclobacillus suci]GEO24682.1 hypothetical protein AAC03nite_04670 [Alicyclobacillus acidoterrestris]
MKRRYIAWLATTLMLGCVGSVFSAPHAYADTIETETPAEDLTSLATISTSITGLADSTFQRDEQKYQQYPLTDPVHWTGYCHQGGRQVTVQFANPVDVQHVQITLEQDAGAGIYYPSDVQFQAYENGQWIALTTVNSSIPESDTNKTTQVFQFDSSAGVETTEIRIAFPVELFVFARGLDITGSTTETGETPTYPVVAPSTASPSTVMSPDSINDHGIANMLLVPTGSHGQLGTWSAGDFVPMLEYINPAGQAVSPLFDTMLFSPYSNVPNTVAGWTGYIDDLFQAGQELDALNQAVGLTNQSLNRPGYKEKVVLSIPYFPYGVADFGNVDGQELSFYGTSTDEDAVAARTTAMKWYVSTLLGKWQAANYQNLQLVGLYWDHEQLNPGLPGDEAMFQAASNVAHSNGLPIFWIPFYGANGTADWQTLGMDAAWLQPNYIEEGADADVTRIRNAEQIATRHGMGVEIELTALDSLTQSLYETQLNFLRSDGFGSNRVSHAYYDGSKLLLDAEESSNPAERQIYDDTAAFMLD